MKTFKIRKYWNGSPIYSGLSTLDLKLEKPNLLKTLPQVSSLLFPPLLLKVPESIANSSWYKMAKLKSDVNNIGKLWDLFKGEMLKLIENPNLNTGENIKKIGLGNQAIAAGIGLVTDLLTNKVSDKLFGDSELGRGMGTLFSSGLSSAGNTITNNIIKGTTLTEGLSLNAGASVAGAAAGLAANYIGRGISSLGGNSKLARGIGQGVATGLGTVGGTVLGNLAKSGNVLGNSSALFGSTANTLDKAGKITKYGAAINPYGLAMSVIGTGLGAAMGPSKEYSGKHGGITQGMDLAYDGIMAGINFVPGWGLIASGAMALNKGLSNIFGSTDGMTTQDAILGSAFMPAPVKWLNMWGSSKTSSFRNLSWLNAEKAGSFMGNAFGNLSEKFDKAREEAGKTYGTFSQGAFKDALDNINFANNAWDKVMAMADQNELLNIRSLYMTSINNLRYALLIGGAWLPVMRGKLGMKIFNNATNHNIGMRLLSAAALIDNKQMILSAQTGVKIPKLQYAGQIVKSDNTKVLKPVVVEPVERKLLPGLQFFNNHGLIIVVEPKQEAVLLDNRDSKVREESHKKSVQVRKQELMKKAEEQTAQVVGAVLERTTPSYWVLLATGQGLGTAGSLAVDLVSPFVLGKGLQLTGKGLLLVGKGANKLARFGISPYTGKWTLFGNREYRFKPEYLGINGTPIESRGVVPQITAENAASMTPEQWTVAQDAAIARGDMAEAQRLRDLHFKINSPNNRLVDTEGNPVRMIHGSPVKFTEFRHKDNPYGTHGRGMYFGIAPENGRSGYGGANGQTYLTYLNGKSIYPDAGIIMRDNAGKVIPNDIMYEIIGTNSYDEFINSVTNQFRDRFEQYNQLYDLKNIAKNIDKKLYQKLHDSFDTKGTGIPDIHKKKHWFRKDEKYATFNPARAGEIVVRDANQIKLADAVTYDNSGVRIPLGKRDNFKLNDIRYSWLPWFLGGSTAATLYNTNK